MISSAHPGYSNFTVYLTLPEKLSEFEVCIRVRDLFENGIFAVECVEKLDCIYCDPADERSLSLFAIRIDVNKKLDSFGLVIKPLHGVTDLILPKQDVVDSRLIERIRQIPQVYQINSMKRNGCFRFNEQEDMVCMRVLSQTGTLEEQKSILQELHQTMNADSTPVIEEFQLRSSFPWLDDEFIQMNGNTVSIAVVDLRTFESEHVVEILHILRELEIFYYLVGGKRMVIYGDGEQLVKLRMNLLPMDVHIPIGQKQGAFQVNMRKSCVNRNDTLHFEVTVTKIGAFTTIPVQIPTGDIQETITQDNLSNCEVCKFLAGKYSAENFALQWTESSGNDVLCLCFEIPQEYECQLPICIDSDKQLTQIVARGPNVRSIQAGFVSKKSETKIEHWQGVVRKKLNDDSVRKNQLAFERQRPSSATRFYALRTLQIEEGLCKTTCVVGNEEAPFFFTDTVRVGDLRSFLEVKEELLLHWRDRSLFEDSLASTVYFSDKDEQHKMKLKNCIVQVRLFVELRSLRSGMEDGWFYMLTISRSDHLVIVSSLLCVRLASMFNKLCMEKKELNRPILLRPSALFQHKLEQQVSAVAARMIVSSSKPNAALVISQLRPSWMTTVVWMTLKERMFLLTMSTKVMILLVPSCAI